MELPAKILLCALLIGIFAYAILSRRHRLYVGYGWLLDWRDGNVIVLSRLLNSPSGRAKVPIGSILVSYDGHPMRFESAEAFTSYLDGRTEPDLGEVGVFVLKHGGKTRKVTMTAETIRTHIPYYPPLPRLSAWGRMCTTESMHRCPKTGQWYITRRLGGFGYEMMTR